jgi:hypothetical protein
MNPYPVPPNVVGTLRVAGVRPRDLLSAQLTAQSTTGSAECQFGTPAIVNGRRAAGSFEISLKPGIYLLEGIISIRPGRFARCVSHGRVVVARRTSSAQAPPVEATMDCGPPAGVAS